MFSLVSVFNYQSKESLEKLLFESTKAVNTQKILVDDASGVDGIKDLAEEYGWTYIRNSKPSGIAASVNQGVKESLP